MNTRLFPFLLLCFAPILSADQVVLKNGDTITGNIVKQAGGKLTIKSEFLGEVTMPWSAVKSLKSDQSLTVVFPGGETLAGKVSTSGDNLEVAAETTIKTLPLATVAGLRDAAEQHTFERLQHPRLLELWTGSYDLALALARGNARTTTFGNNVYVARVSRTDKITASFSQLYATARVDDITSTTASALRGGWTYDRNLTPRFFVSTLNNYEHEKFQNLNLRFVLGGGFGVNALKTERTTLAISGGGDYERENFTNNLVRNSGEANFGEDLVYKVSAATNVTQAFRFFPNLTYTGEYRANFDLSGVTTIRKWMGWHLSASDRLVSNPVFGRQRNDLIISTGFHLTFGK
jgi:hypothetical protein